MKEIEIMIVGGIVASLITFGLIHLNVFPLGILFIVLGILITISIEV